MASFTLIFGGGFIFKKWLDWVSNAVNFSVLFFKKPNDPRYTWGIFWKLKSKITSAICNYPGHEHCSYGFIYSLVQ